MFQVKTYGAHVGSGEAVTELSIIALIIVVGIPVTIYYFVVNR